MLVLKEKFISMYKDPMQQYDYFNYNYCFFKNSFTFTYVPTKNPVGSSLRPRRRKNCDYLKIPSVLLSMMKVNNYRPQPIVKDGAIELFFKYATVCPKELIMARMSSGKVFSNTRMRKAKPVISKRRIYIPIDFISVFSTNPIYLSMQPIMSPHTVLQFSLFTYNPGPKLSNKIICSYKDRWFKSEAFAKKYGGILRINKINIDLFKFHRYQNNILTFRR